MAITRPFSLKISPLQKVTFKPLERSTLIVTLIPPSLNLNGPSPHTFKL